MSSQTQIFIRLFPHLNVQTFIFVRKICVLENIDTHQNMTKSKRMFAEMLVQARGHGDADEMAKTMSLVDIIYEIKKEELKKATPEPEKESPPPSTEPVVEEKKAESFIEEEEPIVIMKIKDFWSRLTHDSDTD